MDAIDLAHLLNIIEGELVQYPEREFNEGDECILCAEELREAGSVIRMRCCRTPFCTNCLLMQLRGGSARAPLMNYLKCSGCQRDYGVRVGQMPKGTMKWSVQKMRASHGAERTIVIGYTFPSGVQGPTHPNPNVGYSGTARTAYLPFSEEGVRALRVLAAAFNRRHSFTIGRSVTTSRDNTVVWNIHHKTNVNGGAANYGYPDETYFDRLSNEARGFGIDDEAMRGFAHITFGDHRSCHGSINLD